MSNVGTGYALGARLILTAAHLVQPHRSRIIKARIEPGTITASGWIDCRLLWATAPRTLRSLPQMKTSPMSVLNPCSG